jgi:hypothetical protein
MVYFHDLGDGLIPNRLGYSIQASLFYTRPGNPIFEKAIRLVVDHCRSGQAGAAPICPTAPGVLGRAIAAEGRKANHNSGDFMPLTPFHPNNNRSCLLSDGAIIAKHKNAWHPSRRPAELTSLGAQGTNDDARMYRRGEIYGPPFQPIQPAG